MKVFDIARDVLVGLLSLSLTLPLSALGASATLGMARGSQTAKLSLDGGKSWLPLGARSLPLIAGTALRSAAGSAQLELNDGDLVSVLPFSSVRFAEKASGTEISLVYGRFTFNLPSQSRLEIVTPSARLEPASGKPIAGELFVSGAGLIGLKMSSGALNVRSLKDAKSVMVTSLEPVFLPSRPSRPGAYFMSDTPATPPPGARGVFDPSGQSIGYIGRDGSLVVYPGYTNDLTRPFPAQFVRLAMNTIPEKDRSEDATPLFDVNGRYLGYLAGQMFYAQAPQGARTIAASDAIADEDWPVGVYAAAGAAGAVGIGVGVAAATGVFSGGSKRKHCPPPASPNSPSPGC